MVELRLPQLTMAMESATLVEWIVADGELVAEGQPVVSVETEKSVEDIESPGEGIIHLLVETGEVVKVDGLMARIGEGAEAEPDVNAEAEANADAEPGPPLPAAPTSAATVVPAAPVPARPAASTPPAAPAARALARAEHIDLATVTGSGPGGRIVLQDVERAVADGANAASAGDADGGRLRQAIVANLVASWTQIPHINIVGELDASGLVEGLDLARQRTDGPKATMTDLVLMAVADALGTNPAANAVGGKPSETINLALAVAGPSGVVAPVVRDVPSLSLDDLSAERHRLVAGARSGQLAPADLAGATCTVSNLGVYPVDLFTPVITGPQAALVTLGRIRRVPVIDGDAIVPGDRIWVDVALDHRTADGAVGGQLLQSLSTSIAALPDHIARQPRRQS